jgi:hypothetical protein
MKTSGLLVSLALAFAPLSIGCADVADGSDPTVSTESDEVAIRPTFDLWNGTGGFRFNFLASNGETLVSSQAYSTRTAALNGVLSVLDNGGIASRYEVKPSADGKSYFNLKAGNNKVIATSETYASAANAQAGVDATIRATAAYLESWDTEVGARFTVFEGSTAGKFYFRLHAKNGEIVLQSETYTSEAAALNGAYSVLDNGGNAANYQVVKSSTSTKYYVRLKSSANGQVIGTSEMYANKANATRARDAIIALLPDVELL